MSVVGGVSLLIDTLSIDEFHLSTDGSLIRAGEGPKVLAPPLIVYMAQANFSLAVADYTLSGYNWRQYGNF